MIGITKATTATALVLLITSSIVACLLLLMRPFTFFTVAFLVNLVIMIVAGVGVMRGRMERLIIFGIVIGALLLGILSYDVYASHQRLPLILGGYGHMLGFLAVIGLMTMSGLMVNGRFRRIAFMSIGLFILIYSGLMFLQQGAGLWVWIMGFFILLPFMAVLFLVTTLFFWKSMKSDAQRVSV
ncbi:hypothetical protein DGWBC_1734 [Dehalogenimonas sp. WBC-2]|nr:hypothetical protein DGWBC_1734 [Dehalogenimonas sp. WBC-2]